MGKVLKYQIKQGDTLQGLAKTYLGDSERWYEIAFYNKLTYPFFTSDLNWKNERKAIGEVTLLADSTVTIPVGSTVATKLVSVFGTNKTQQKKYVTLQSASLVINAPVTIYVEAVDAGEDGNTPELTVTELLDPVIAGVTVINNSPIIGGETVNIKKSGDLILIPLEVLSGETAIGAEDIIQVYDLLFGEDFYLFDSTMNWQNANAVNPDVITADLIEDEFGDLKSTAGIDNLQQSLVLRFITKPGEIPRHPEFGSNLTAMIGKSGSEMMMRMMNLEAGKTARSDPRVVDAIGITVTKNPDNQGRDAFGITGKIVVIGQDEAIPLDMVLTGGL